MYKTGKTIMALCAAVAAASLFPSCEDRITVTSFEPQLVIMSGENTVEDGEDFTFRIYSATGKFVVDAISIVRDDGHVAYSPDRTANEFPVSGITLGREITCEDNNWKTFTASSVTIPERSVYTLTVTLSSSLTSKSVTLKDTFRGYPSN